MRRGFLLKRSSSAMAGASNVSPLAESGTAFTQDEISLFLGLYLTEGEDGHPKYNKEQIMKSMNKSNNLYGALFKASGARERKIGPARRTKNGRDLPEHLVADIAREVDEFAAFRSENPFPSELMVRRWLERELDKRTASRNMLGQPWLGSNGFDLDDVEGLQHGLLAALYDIGLQPFSTSKQSDVGEIGQRLNQRGGLRAMQFHFVILQGIVTSNALLPKGVRTPGVFAFCHFVSKCWSGIGEWQE